METPLAFLGILLYLAVIVLYIALMVKIWKACAAAVSIEKHLKDLSYRDAARYFAEVEKGKITERQQEQAQKLFEVKKSKYRYID